MDAELTFEELKLLRQVSRAVDDVLEESLKARESLQQTFNRLFPVLTQIVGAKGAVVSTLDEELA
ncbi:MAG TPA: adenylate/guanylate cyclase domain-containing protein, partial [Archangium sp.]